METITINNLAVEKPKTPSGPLRIGDLVKVLIKEYNDNYKSHDGIIVGIDIFEKLPALNICCLKSNYGSFDIEFVTYTAQSKNVEITRNLDNVPENMERLQSAAEKHFCKQIEEKQREMKEAEHKLLFFRAWFKHTFLDLKELQGKA